MDGDIFIRYQSFKVPGAAACAHARPVPARLPSLCKCTKKPPSCWDGAIEKILAVNPA